MYSSRSFTLIELLIVIAVVAILSVVVILALNPAELLKQARDSTRLSDINTLNKALSLYQVDNPGGSFGTASTTYISYPEPSAASSTCNGAIGLSTSTLPSGWSYKCMASSTYTKIDGTGWVPANLSSITGGAPISQLPRDPVNTTSSNNYYVYIGNSSNWALTSLLESQKYLSQSGQKDGGYDPGRFEKGSDLALISQGEGLMGWWTMDEGSGTTANDSSGNGNTGTWSGTGQHATTTSKVGSGAGQFNGSNDYIDAGNRSSLDLTGSQVSFSAWIKSTNVNAGYAAVGGKNYGYLLSFQDILGTTRWRVRTSGGIQGATGSTELQNNTWYLVTGTYDGSTARLYINGLQDAAISVSGGNLLSQNYDFVIGTFQADCALTPTCVGNYYFPGLIDDVRVYSRTLTASEIAALYNATR